MLDLSKLVFGGIVLVVVMQIETLSNQILLTMGILASISSSLLGIMLVLLSNSNKKKGV